MDINIIPKYALFTRILVVLSLVLFCRRSAYSLVCTPCDPSSCPAVVCPGDKVRDSCECCLVCAKQRYEKCGGMFEIYGHCDANLTCVIEPNHGDLLTGSESGTCKPTEMMTSSDKCHEAPYSGCSLVNGECVCGRIIACSNPYQFDSQVECNVNKPTSEMWRKKCAKVRCEVHQSPACPEDSLLLEGYVPDGECCPSPRTCECRAERCAYNLCPPNTQRVLVSSGTNLPGSCCDIYQCISEDEEADCRSFRCAIIPLSSITCPSDSITIRNPHPRNRCCPGEPICDCLKNICVKQHCSHGKEAMVKYRANGKPGSCCDIYECSNEKLTAGCSVNGTLFEHGATYEHEHCQICECKMGVSYCGPITCPELRCTKVSMPPGGCCPKCVDETDTTDVDDTGPHPYPVCRSEDNTRTYVVGETWSSDLCTHCACEEGGVVRCKAAFCEDPFTVTAAPTCPSISDCKVDDHCPYGFAYDSSYCQMCYCRNVALGCHGLEKCMVDCPSGHVIDEKSGCSMCQCRQKNCKDVTLCGKQCPYGYKLNKIGCERCKCRRCPPMESCDKECSFGLAQNKYGCVICKCKAISDLTASEMMSARTCTDDRNELRRNDGETWSSGCYTCVCRGGDVMCNVLKCPILMCGKPVMKEGKCCPTCSEEESVGDDYLIKQSLSCRDVSGDWLVEGDTWDFDQCTACTCHNGQVMCTSKFCPPAPCDNPVIVDDQCCPQCLGDVAPSSGRSCEDADGASHASGSSFFSGTCTSCSCQNGLIECFKKECERPLCAYPVLKRGKCCPECLDNSSSFRPCDIDGRIRSYLEEWNKTSDGCTSCSCVNGSVECQPPDCPRISKTCRRIYQRPGACCEECVSSHPNPPTVTVDQESESNIQLIPIAVGISLSLVVVGLLIVAAVIVKRRYWTGDSHGIYFRTSTDPSQQMLHSASLRSTSSEEDKGPKR